MTSSLVGSEMCIRDRNIQSQCKKYAIFDSVGILVRVMREVMPAADSVSYTHLTLPTICSV
eukprot:12581931-Prorocentrum_lima.AAC.1